MKKTYITPSTEIVRISFQESCLSTGSDAVRALGNSTTEEATDYNNGQVISW